MIALLLLFCCSCITVAFGGNDLTRMLHFVSTFGEKDSTWSAMTPVCNWTGVQCTDGAVTLFSWKNRGCNGTANLTQLPELLQTLNLNGNAFTGNIDLTALPASLEALCLGNDQVTSALKTDHEGNYFRGRINLSHLPAGLQYLDLYDGGLCGAGPVSISCGNINFPISCTCNEEYFNCGDC